MFNVEAYYTEAHSGEVIDNSEILEYIRSFKNVVLWGGSYLGNAVGKYLLIFGSKSAVTFNASRSMMS